MKLSNSAAQVSTRLNTARDAELLAALAHRRVSSTSQRLGELHVGNAVALGLRGQISRGRVEPMRLSRARSRNRPPRLHLLAGTTDRWRSSRGSASTRVARSPARSGCSSSRSGVGVISFCGISARIEASRRRRPCRFRGCACPSTSASLKVRPIAITSPTDFICVPSVGSAPGNFSNCPLGNLDDDVVDRRLEAGRRLARDVVA